MAGIEQAGLERRALALIERLLAHPDDERFRLRLLRREEPEVIARILRLEGAGASGLTHRHLLPDPPDAAPPSPAPPERFGPFRITRLIGRGGMGEIWQGERDDGLYEQTVAIKLVKADLPVRAGFAFENERRILARLEHPNIARLIDGGTTPDGRACFVMEYVDGVPLDDACAGRPSRARLDLFLQTVSAVGYAHGKLIAHGDLKPTNILVDGDGRVRLLDFGIARLVTDEQSGLALSGVVTSGFASPQRLAGDPSSVFDDLFALGRILQIILGADAKPDLVAIAATATAEHETERYTSTADLVADIHRFQSGRPVAAVRPSWSYLARKYLRRNWKRVAAMALLACAALFASWSYVRAEHARRLAQARFDETHQLADYLMFDLYDALDTLPDTTRVREAITLKGHAYLGNLAATPDAPPGLRLDIARGYLRLAEVQGLSGNANLGKSRATIADIARAETVLGALSRTYPERSDVRMEMARALTMRSRALIYIDHDPSRALETIRRAEGVLRADGVEPTDPAARRTLWAARLAEGDALTWLNRPKEALAILEAELAAARGRKAPSVEDRRLAIRNLRFLGEAEFYANRLPRAISYLRTGLDEARAVIRFSGDRPSDIIGFVNVAQVLGEAQSAAHRDPDAVMTLTAAREAASRLTKLDPADVEARKRLLSVGTDLAEAMAGGHQLGQAAALIAKVQDGYRALLRTDAGDAALFRAYARSIRPAGDIARRQGQPVQACAWFRRADDAWRAFDRRWGASASDKADDIALVRAALRGCS